MSSPMSSLKKHKAGFGQRPVPFRNPTYTDDESKLLEEITGGMASQRMKTRDPFLGGIPKIPDPGIRASQGFGMTGKDSSRTYSNLDLLDEGHNLSRSHTDIDLLDEGHNISTSNGLYVEHFMRSLHLRVPNDHELMSTMMSRITQLEGRLAYQTKELEDKDRRIKVLSEKYNLIQKAQDRDRTDHVAELENKCFVLQSQIHDMEEFLADYGMIWVGQKSNEGSDNGDSDDDTRLWRPESSVSQEPTFKVNYDLLVENIKDLNALAGEGSLVVKNTKDGATLKPTDAVQLTLYANGILMFNGPFRPFTDLSTQHCVQDILDGYFPTELQGRYPDGVPFNVTDKREVYYEDKRSTAFKGAGQTLGGETVPSRLVPTNVKDKSTNMQEPDTGQRETTSELPGQEMSIENFLQKLPRSVVRSGKVIDIRNSIGGALQSNGATPGGVTVIETDTMVEMKKRLEDSYRPHTPRNISTLRIKSEDGNHTFILKMQFDETIGELRKYITQQRSPDAPEFEIVSAYPTKVHSDNKLTLLEAGLTPNAVAHLKVKKK